MKPKLNIEEIKSLSIAIKKNLVAKDIMVKQSLVLESIAQAIGYNDWNTLSSCLNKDSFTCDIEAIIPTMYGNKYKFQYDITKENLRIEVLTSNASASYCLSFSMNGLKIITSQLYDYQNLVLSGESVESFFKKVKTIKENDVEIGFINEEFMIINDSAIIKINEMMNFTFVNQLFVFFNKVTDMVPNNERKIYPLTDELLLSMVMRYDHSIALIEDEEKISKYLNKMRELYKLYNNGLSNIEIAEYIDIGLISLQQLREEVSGNGFYKPKVKR